MPMSCRTGPLRAGRQLRCGQRPSTGRSRWARAIFSCRPTGDPREAVERRANARPTRSEYLSFNSFQEGWNNGVGNSNCRGRSGFTEGMKERKARAKTPREIVRERACGWGKAEFFGVLRLRCASLRMTVARQGDSWHTTRLHWLHFVAAHLIIVEAFEPAAEVFGA